MQLRVTRPAFANGIRPADSNQPVPHLPSIEHWRQGIVDLYTTEIASRQEMCFVGGQCHVEYYCGPKTTLFFPWGNGLKVEQIDTVLRQL